MGIKAIGTIIENPNDGKRVCVDWSAREDPPREWYFYTYQRTVRRVLPGEWTKDALLAFAFDRRPQDIDALWEVFAAASPSSPSIPGSE